jgi:hypothetical protein
MTTPETRKGRISYAIVLGTLDAVLRYKRVDFAPFFALFILSGLLPVFRRVFAPATEERVWKTGLWHFGASGLPARPSVGSPSPLSSHP